MRDGKETPKRHTFEKVLSIFFKKLLIDQIYFKIQSKYRIFQRKSHKKKKAVKEHHSNLMQSTCDNMDIKSPTRLQWRVYHTLRLLIKSAQGD